MFQLQNCSTDVFILKTTSSGELQDLKYHSLHYSANKRLHLFGPMSADARSNCHIKRSRSKLKSSGRATWLTTVYSHQNSTCNLRHHLYKIILLKFSSLVMYKHRRGMHWMWFWWFARLRALGLVLRLYHQQKTLSSLDSRLVFVFAALCICTQHTRGKRMINCQIYKSNFLGFASKAHRN